MLEKVVAQNRVHTVICTDLIDPDMKPWIDKFDEEVEKQLDETKFVDDFGADLYIDNVFEANEAAHRYGSNTPSGEAHGYMMMEECTKQDYIVDVASSKYYSRVRVGI